MKKALLFLACMGCFISCDNNSNKEQQAPNVKVIRAEQSDTSSERSYSFISQPYRTTELSFRVGVRYILSIHKADSSSVKES